MPTTELSAVAPETDDDRLLTEAQVSERIGFTRNTLRCWRSDGVGPQWCRIGGRSVRYKESDLQAWIKAQESKQ